MILEFQSHSISATSSRLRTDSNNISAEDSEPLVLVSRTALVDGSPPLEFPDEIDILATFIGVERDFQNQVNNDHFVVTVVVVVVI